KLWQHKGKGCTRAHCAFGRYFSTVPLHDALDRCKTDSGSGELSCRRQSLERLEEPASSARIEARAIIPDKNRASAVGHSHTNPDCGVVPPEVISTRYQ
ncbi:MAG TPA: hypothetical protein VF135_03220, partial [Terriglobales bacterium]